MTDTYKEANRVIRDFGKHDPVDLEFARQIASAAIDIYGEFSSNTDWEIYETSGIWNDHPAVQAALCAIRLMREDHEKVKEET